MLLDMFMYSNIDSFSNQDFLSMKKNLGFHFWKRCTFPSQMPQEKGVLVGFETAKPVLDPLLINMPLVQAEEQSCARLGCVCASQSLFIYFDEVFVSTHSV